MAKTLALGGPMNGELVDWPLDRYYYAVIDTTPSTLSMDKFGPTHRTIYYNLQKISLFGYYCPIWVCEREDLNDPAMVDKLLAEILSYKGANLINAGKRQGK